MGINSINKKDFQIIVKQINQDKMEELKWKII